MYRNDFRLLCWNQKCDLPSWIYGQDRLSTLLDNRPDMPIFAIFFYKSKHFSKVIPPTITVFTHDVATFSALLRCPLLYRYSNLFQNGSMTKKISTKTLIFWLVGCHGNIPWVIAKWMQNLSSTYIAVPIPEKFVRIYPVVPENLLLRCRPLKIYKIKKKHLQNIYPAGQTCWVG